MAIRVARDVVLRRFGLQRSYTPMILVKQPGLIYSDPFELVVARELLADPRLAFAQVGAFDGLANDPIRAVVRTHRLSGIIVEPQRRAYEALAENYRDHPQVTLVNAAIASRDGEQTLYTSRDGAIQQASFDKSHLLRHRIPEARIVGQRVRCYTLQSLLHEFDFEHIRVLQIDAEGFDYEILKTLDFSRTRPAVIRFEHAHLSPDDCDACVAWLGSLGYRFITERRDIIAFRFD